MSGWYGKVTADPDDLSPLIDCMAYYEGELKQARVELKVEGRIELIAAKLPGLSEFRFNQLQEIEAILRYLNIRFDKAKGKAHRFYMEGYNRALTSRDAEKYADCDDDVLSAALLVNQMALLRNKYLGVMKGLDALNFQIGHIVRLRVAGIEDASL
ncbi:MAG: hypothetical protein ABI207_07920 [Crocinitomicaceae bacterium]